MLLNRAEYEAMYQVEEALWWYRHLHDRVLAALEAHAVPKTAKILDAGCGTGGLMRRLRQAGYTNLVGFDFNETAVELSREREVGEILQLDIRRVAEVFPEDSFDVILSNDVWYQFEDPDLLPLLDGLIAVLAPGGLLVSNNQALAAFRGMHDVAVGAKRRFHPSFFVHWQRRYPHLVVEQVMWSRWLSPLIWGVRFIQRIQLRFGWHGPIQSDVSLPSPVLNGLFYWLVSQEFKRSAPTGGWGSSLFVQMKKGK